MTKKIDPHGFEKMYFSWKDGGMSFTHIKGKNSEEVIKYILDMEVGRNVNISSRKGARSFARLMAYKTRLNVVVHLILKKTKKKFIYDVNEKELLHFFNDMRAGRIVSPYSKKRYTSVGTYVKAFKAFWHWHMLVERKAGREVPDVTIDVDSRSEKPKFNYFTVEQLQVLCDQSSFYYRVLMMFLFDSGIRAPTELMNVKVSDFKWHEKNSHYILNIREETSKTFGRKIKLLLCSNILKSYIEQNCLKEDEYLFTVNPKNMNNYLRQLGYRLLELGEPVVKKRNNRSKYTAWVKKGLTLYDFRHSSACYWLPRYKSEAAMKYRFGWKKSSMIHYYTEFLGMKDTIQEEDLYVDVTKTELEGEIKKLKDTVELQRETHHAEVEEMKRSLKQEVLKEVARQEVIKEVMAELQKKFEFVPK